MLIYAANVTATGIITKGIIHKMIKRIILERNAAILAENCIFIPCKLAINRAICFYNI